MEDRNRTEGRWMGLDVGARVIGIALTDPLRITARPLSTLRRGSLQQDTRALLRLAEEHGVSRVIVGLPLHLNGTPSRILDQIRPLAQALSEKSRLRVEWCDERLSTRQAEELMSEARVPLSLRRQRRDEFAAAVILTRYLGEQSP